MAAFGGVNLLTFGPGEGFAVNAIKLPEKTKKNLRSWMLMCFTGGSRHSSQLQKELEKGMSEEEKIQALLALKNAVDEAKKALKKEDWQKLGHLLDEAWENKKKSNPLATNERIDYLYKVAKEQGALGGKIMGAGGEGHMFFLCPPEKQKLVIGALEAEGSKFINFELDEKGLDVKEQEFTTNYHPVVVRESFIPRKNWAVFLDRDGTINKEIHLLHRIEDFEFIPGAIEAIKKLNQAEIPVIIYHNASV